MAKYVKEIVSPGVYWIPVPEGVTEAQLRQGKIPFRRTQSGDLRVKRVVTADLLQNAAQTFQVMREKGFKVPAPYAHSKDAVPLKIGSGGTVPSGYENAGFWDTVYFDQDSQKLVGVLDSPDTDKIGKTVRETSIYMNPIWEDSQKNEFQDAIMHIACTTHTIEPGQGNFIPAEDCMVLAMSFADKPGKPKPPVKPSKPAGGTPDHFKAPAGDTQADLEDSGNLSGGEDDTEEGDGSDVVASGAELIPQLLELLRHDSVNIALPQDTNENNLAERLLIALTQKVASEGDEEREGTVQKPPEGAQQRNAPFTMSFNPAQIKALADAKVVNPDTKLPFTAVELEVAGKATTTAELDVSLVMAHPKFKEVTDVSVNLLNTITNQARVGYGARIQRLQETGRINKGYAETTLAPLVSGFAMSFENGQPKQQALDVILLGLEALPSVTQPSAQYSQALAMSYGGDGVPSGAVLHGLLPHGEGAPTGDVAPSMDLTNAVLKRAGLLP